MKLRDTPFRINKQREIIERDRQGTQQQRPESPTVTPPGIQGEARMSCTMLLPFEIRLCVHHTILANLVQSLALKNVYFMSYANVYFMSYAQLT